MPAATHLRKQIREAVATLVTGLSTTSARVHQSRMRPKSDAGLPCLLVHTNDTEQIEAADTNTLQQRSLPIAIRGIAKGGATLDDTLDQIALEVETALAADPRLGGKASMSRLVSVDTDFDDTTDKPVGEIQLTYLYTYFTQAGTPGVNA
jgi:hypothetical protein